MKAKKVINVFISPMIIMAGIAFLIISVLPMAGCSNKSLKLETAPAKASAYDSMLLIKLVGSQGDIQANGGTSLFIFKLTTLDEAGIYHEYIIANTNNGTAIIKQRDYVKP